MLRLGSGASNFDCENEISCGTHDRSVVVGGGTLVCRLPGSAAAVAGVGEGVVLAVVGLLLPKPINVHHKNRIATSPSATAATSFFFSLALLRSTACIPIYSGPEY